MSRTSLLLISQASQTSRTLLPVAKQESRPLLPSIDQVTQISWILPQGIDMGHQSVASSDQGSQMSSVNLQDQGTRMITPSGMPVTEKTLEPKRPQVICQSSSVGNQGASV